MWRNYYIVNTLEEALKYLAEYGERGRIVAGGTDLVLEMERGGRKGIDSLIDISTIRGLDAIHLDSDGSIHLGALVTHNHCVASDVIYRHATPLYQAAVQVGSPQIRNRGTIAGNLITASPANDTIPALIALGAEIKLRSLAGERSVRLADFYTGVRKTIMRPDEILVEISLHGLKEGANGKVDKGAFYKFGLRKAQAISVVNAAVVIQMQGEIVEKAVITLGAVAPTIVRATEAEAALEGAPLTEENVEKAARLAMQAARPIDDLRSSGAYRKEALRVAVKRALLFILDTPTLPEKPNIPVLWGRTSAEKFVDNKSVAFHLTDSLSCDTPILTRINGKVYSFSRGHHKTLLDLIRDEAGLTGSKEGCGEGECGACTLFLDGVAVMGCLVPAPRAHGAEITTIEGIGEGEKLHPVQQAFINDGAVQCGFCTPGFIMSAVKLLEENSHPNREEIQQAISGNLCRCTGYYKIMDAIEHAAAISTAEGF